MLSTWKYNFTGTIAYHISKDKFLGYKIIRPEDVAYLKAKMGKHLLIAPNWPDHAYIVGVGIVAGWRNNAPTFDATFVGSYTVGRGKYVYMWWDGLWRALKPDGTPYAPEYGNPGKVFLWDPMSRPTKYSDIPREWITDPSPMPKENVFP